MMEKKLDCSFPPHGSASPPHLAPGAHGRLAPPSPCPSSERDGSGSSLVAGTELLIPSSLTHPSIKSFSLLTRSFARQRRRTRKAEGFVGEEQDLQGKKEEKGGKRTRRPEILKRNSFTQVLLDPSHA